MDRIYFDYASTTPCDLEVVKSMEPYFFTEFGNASSPHTIGRAANKALEDSRTRLANFIGALPEEIIFNSGATEGNNHAVLGMARATKNWGGHIIVSAIEHHSVLEPVEFLKKQGFRVTYLKVNEDGLVNSKDVLDAICDDTILIAVMHASNEIGTVEPVADIGAIAKEKNIPFLVDACQTVGHIPVDVNEFNCDLLSLSAHKFYGPKGVGALYIRKATKITPYLLGGDQERSRRASTQNIPGAVGLAKAIELCALKMRDEENIQKQLRDYLIKEISKRIERVKVNGHLSRRLPNNVHFSFEGVEGEYLLMSLDMNNMAASMGSACTSGAMEPSHVLRAIGLSDDLSYGSLRITIGRWTTKEHIDYLLEKLPGLVKGMRI